jgi:glycosyltransferase involved in cell wall biosynthesis
MALPSTEVEVSVVIPFKDAAPSFADQLEAVAGQRLEGEWEVVLVGNGSRDDAQASAKASRAG